MDLEHYLEGITLLLLFKSDISIAIATETLESFDEHSTLETKIFVTSVASPLELERTSCHYSDGPSSL